jgi:uncharacterized spore protein YtfJ
MIVPGFGPFRWSDYAMQPEDILNRVREVATVRQVFGEPYEKDGMLVVPVARIRATGTTSIPSFS